MTRDELIDGARGALEADARIQAAWLAGSFGSGQEDAYSDVDLLVAVEPDKMAEFTKDAVSLMNEIAKTVLCRQLPGVPVWNAISEEWLRFDLVAVPPAALKFRSRDSLRCLFDRADLHDTLQETRAEFEPSAERVLDLVVEFLRCLGLGPIGIGRKEFSVGVWGAAIMRDLLSRLMLEEAEIADPGGALRLYVHLSDEQCQVLASLPPVEAQAESLMAWNAACTQAFLPRARRLLDSLGGQWPESLERALRAHLQRELRVDL